MKRPAGIAQQQSGRRPAGRPAPGSDRGSQVTSPAPRSNFNETAIDRAALDRMDTALERLASIDGSLRQIAGAVAGINQHLAGLVRGRRR
jgi:hypothetical protein